MSHSHGITAPYPVPYSLTYRLTNLVSIFRLPSAFSPELTVVTNKLESSSSLGLCTLLDIIPREIRDMIYAYVLYRENGVRHTPSYRRRKDSEKSITYSWDEVEVQEFKSEIDIALLHTCRRVYSEDPGPGAKQSPTSYSRLQDSLAFSR